VDPLTPYWSRILLRWMVWRMHEQPTYARQVHAAHYYSNWSKSVGLDSASMLLCRVGIKLALLTIKLKPSGFWSAGLFRRSWVLPNKIHGHQHAQQPRELYDQLLLRIIDGYKQTRAYMKCVQALNGEQQLQNELLQPLVAW
jgi:hypothetical protein